MDEIKKLKELIDSHHNIVFFGGAGVSTESNIPDFRSTNGIFNKNLNENLTPEQLVSHSFFVSHPQDFFEFYKDKLIYKNAKPNKAHEALAYLEKTGKLNAVITQNIDGLHQAAGSSNVFELHGSIHRNYCTNCGKAFSLDEFLNLHSVIPYCDNCNSIVKPDVVLYEEALDNTIVSKTIDALSKADLLIIGGTSLVVYPAASFIDYFNGDCVVLINKSNTEYDRKASLKICDSIGEVLYKTVFL